MFHVHDVARSDAINDDDDFENSQTLLQNHYPKILIL